MPDDDDEALMLAQIERLKQGAYEACLVEVESNLEAFLSKNPGGTYEQWIGELHPENVSEEGSIDHRLYNEGSIHLRLWNARVERRRAVCARAPDAATTSHPRTPPPPQPPPISRPFPTLASPQPIKPGAPAVSNPCAGFAGMALGRPGTASPAQPSGRSPCRQGHRRSLSQPAFPGRPSGVSPWPCSAGEQTCGDCLFALGCRKMLRSDLPPTFKCVQPAARLCFPNSDLGRCLPLPPRERAARMKPAVGPQAQFLHPTGAYLASGGAPQHMGLWCFLPCDAGAWHASPPNELVVSPPPRPTRWSLPAAMQPVQTPAYAAPRLMRAAGTASPMVPPWPPLQPQMQPVMHCARWMVP